MNVIRAPINHMPSLLFTLPPTNVRQSQMTPIVTPRVTVILQMSLVWCLLLFFIPSLHSAPYENEVRYNTSNPNPILNVGLELDGETFLVEVRTNNWTRSFEALLLDS